MGKASEIFNISIKEFLYELRKRGIHLNYDLEESKYYESDNLRHK
ncbi:UPF0175 family protein [Methanocaldococcus sp.]